MPQYWNKKLCAMIQDHDERDDEISLRYSISYPLLFVFPLIPCYGDQRKKGHPSLPMRRGSATQLTRTSHMVLADKFLAFGFGSVNSRKEFFVQGSRCKQS
jgi:hypothetical protein